MLRPIPAALASCTRFFEAMSAMRESFATLQQLRVGPISSTPMTPSDSSDGVNNSKFLTPPQWREGTTSSDDSTVEEREVLDGINQRRLSWPPSRAS